MKKNEQDGDAQFIKMTTRPVYKLIIPLSIPTIITMLITSVYNLADTAFVGQLGNSPSGAVGVVFGFMAILQAIGFMFGQGSGSIIARMLGNKQNEDVHRVASTSFIVTFGLTALICMFGLIFLTPLVYALGSTPTIAVYAKQYIVFLLICGPFTTTSFVMNNILRYEGRAALGMIGMLSGALLNVIGDPILMFACHLGVLGAGLSTAISQTVSFAILLYMFKSGKTQSHITLKAFVADIKMIFDIMATGLPSMLRQGLTAIATMLLNLQCAPYGDVAVAGMSIVSRITMFVFSIAVGVGQGFQPVSAYNYGAKKYDRVIKAYYFTVFLSQVMLSILVAIVMLNMRDLITLFRDDEQVIEIATRSMYLQCIALLFLPMCMVTEMLLQSTGNKFGASFLSTLRSGLLFIVCLLILPPLRGLAGIQESQPLAYILSFPICFVYTVIFFKKLKQKNQITHS